MFGWGEMGLVIILALLLLGPDNMVDAARKMGRLYAEYKKARRRLELEILYGFSPPDESILQKVNEVREKSITESVRKNIVEFEQPKDINNRESSSSESEVKQ
ncbi:twin-arginine translocase TatA/TatE family subunit [Geoglobus acetivorans]|uniref:Twin-arginine translocase TatA/TatE family subunit n=1 Tax=Geoglobus acetivorans TaxID=565033 RepID=A0ABZ3H5I6_GEOAI|nr:twin-arginine translocase TatA/TatE family subunit [Geoglobus acetivorans]